MVRGVSFFRSKIVLSVLASALLFAFASEPADAAKKPAQKKEASRKAKRSKGGGGGYNPPYAALVVDANSGKVLFADSPDELRHPASLTKVMTLYILFEELERGSMTLDTPLKVSAEASRQAPSKLGLLPGETIRVEDAIKALVTKSANDVAVAIAENISGSESAFAARMTQKARALGMSRTVYRNASGLPNDGQITTARDLVVLGRAIQDRYPRQFRYFSTKSFVWKGRTIGSHNRLVGSVKGVDGIKTGYVRASGFNLLTSANDGGRRIVATVLGGRSGASRDAAMRQLVAQNLPKAATGRTAPAIAEAQVPEAVAKAIPTPVAAPARIAPPMPSTAVLTPMPRPLVPQVRPAVVAAAANTTSPAAPAPVAAEPVDLAASAEVPDPATISSDAVSRRIAMATAVATTTPGSSDDGMRWVVGAQPKQTGSVATAYAGGTTPGSAPVRRETIRASASSPPPVRVATAAPIEASMFPAPAHPNQMALASQAIEAATPSQATAASSNSVARSGWIIQIGATPDAAQAKALIDRAAPTVRKVDGRAEAFTETVAKGEQTLYRARYAGFSEKTADAACKALKKSALSCFTIKN
jgi:D-alanyl-D-alanine carboxypeptidase